MDPFKKTQLIIKMHALCKILQEQRMTRAIRANPAKARRELEAIKAQVKRLPHA
jgi:hypothetical protein